MFNGLRILKKAIEAVEDIETYADKKADGFINYDPTSFDYETALRAFNRANSLQRWIVEQIEQTSLEDEEQIRNLSKNVREVKRELGI